MNIYDYGIGQHVAKNAAGLSTNFAKGTDLVFVMLPCKSDARPENFEALGKIVKEFSANSKIDKCFCSLIDSSILIDFLSTKIS